MSRRHAGWKVLAETVAPGARVTRLRRLAGAGMTDAYDITLDRTPQRVVVKIYRDGDDTAPLEWSRLEFAQRVTALCLLLWPDIAGGSSDELAVYDLMCVMSGRHYAAESLAVDSKLGHVPNLRSALAHLDEHLRRTLRRLDQ